MAGKAPVRWAGPAVAGSAMCWKSADGHPARAARGAALEDLLPLGLAILGVIVFAVIDFKGDA
jgi:hypothetical protein